MSHSLDTARCVGSPPSWLALERYHLGELPPAEQARVDEHLQTCPACQRCAERIVADAEAALPPLAISLVGGASPATTPAQLLGDAPLVEPAPARGERSDEVASTASEAMGERGAGERRTAWQRLVAWLRGDGGWTWAAVGAAACAILAALLLRLPGDGGVGRRVGGGLLGDWPGPRVRFKGGDLALTLVRLRGGRVDEAPTTFARGDRFKVEVTCSAKAPVATDVVVFQKGERPAFPLAAVRALRCGNRAPIAGAFSVSGKAPVVVCVVVDERGRTVDRAALERAGPRTLDRRRAVCRVLRPAMVGSSP